MAKTQREPKASKERRKATLSPELSEFLHMLKSLETEFNDKQVQPT